MLKTRTRLDGPAIYNDPPACDPRDEEDEPAPQPGDYGFYAWRARARAMDDSGPDDDGDY